MADEMHEVVQLLLARMKSHPEEFAMVPSRWDWMLNGAMDHGSDEERAALKKGLRPIRLQAVHELMLDELCNGDERRRKSNGVLRIDEVLRIDASGNMGIGTKTPSTTLQVSTKEGNSK
jgi:hypothetical protein